MRWEIQLSFFFVAMFVSCDEKASHESSFKDAPESQSSNDIGYVGDTENRLPGIGDKFLIPEILEGLKVLHNWNLELDRKLCVDEDYNLGSYQRGYSVESSGDLVRIWLGGKLGLDKNINPKSFIVQWIRFEYTDKYRTFEKKGMKWELVEDVSIEGPRSN